MKNLGFIAYAIIMLAFLPGQVAAGNGHGKPGNILQAAYDENTGASAGKSPANLTVKINFRLYTETGTVPIDGNLVVFGSQYSNFIDVDDGLKINASAENFAIVVRDTILTVDARQPVMDKDTIQFITWSLAQKTYRIDMTPQNLSPGLTAILIDSFANPSGEVIDFSGGTVSKVFTVTSDPKSGGTQFNRRFTLLLAQIPPLPVRFVSLSAIRTGDAVEVKWKVAEEADIATYEVQRSADGTRFFPAGTISATGSSIYSWKDISPYGGNSFYRIKAVNTDGNVKYTNIARVFWGNTSAGFSVYPNPVRGSSVNVQFISQLPGRYNLTIIDNAGRIFTHRIIEHNGGSAIFPVELPGILKAGNYQMKITDPDKKIIIQPLLIQPTN